MERYLDQFKNCLQKENPFCQAACPFHINIFDFIEKTKRGAFKAAYKVYRDGVGFPAIISELCPRPCQEVCPRGKVDEAVKLNLLEKACVENGYTDPTDYNLPMKNKKIAIIGAGISGLSCALRLATKKYEVVLYEKSSRIGGQLWELMDSTVFLSDIEHQMKHENYTLLLETPVLDATEMEEKGFDAVYVATGKGGTHFGLLEESLAEKKAEYSLIIGQTGYFAGGSLIGKTVVEAAADGLNMATAIDNFLKTKNLIYPKDTRDTAMCQLDSKFIYEKSVIPENGQNYTKEEAEDEARRCIECQCDTCRSHCDITDFYGKWPLRIRDEIMATTLPGSAEVKATPAKRLLSTCNQCGRCKDFCPEHIDLGGLILAGRQSMHRQGKTAWFFHDFWVRDMEFTNGEECAITRAPKGMKSCNFAFFPGCQLSAGKPELVEKVYEFLVKKEPNMGLMLQCCGVPVEWAGDVEKHLEVVGEIRKSWTDMGKPTIVLACPTCVKKFKEHLPEIRTIFIYEMLEKLGLPVKEDACKKLLGEAAEGFSIFDSCATRNEPELQASVRRYAEAAGCRIEALPQNGSNANCCGFGGQSSICNPEFAKYVVKKRMEEGDKPYITYCINCRDFFLNEGKPSLHLLELLFKEESKLYYQPNITERRNNRRALKQRLLKKYWGEEMEEKTIASNIKLIIAPELKEKLGKDRIIEEDLILVIEFCERTGRRIYNESKGTYSGYCEVGYMTHWVEYKPIDIKNAETIVADPYIGENSQTTFELINAYCHRMKIELEAVWNGRKTEIDV